MRQELAHQDIGLRCVYLSQKDSVFSDAEISEDLHHVLSAINDPANKRRLKTAFATPLMRGFTLDFSVCETLDEGDESLECLIEEFSHYRDSWIEHGVMTAINQLLARDNGKLLLLIAKRADSDRILTDLRHLADLLQQRDLECDSAEQLIDWYGNQLEDDSAVEQDSKRIRLESDEDLVKIVTIHVAKGLEYPVVFLPFFFMPWKMDLKKNLPLDQNQA